jgi:hypothetical protein
MVSRNGARTPRRKRSTGSVQGWRKTEDWTPLEKSAIEYKYFCPGIGMVLEMNAKHPSERNELTAVKRP